MFKLNRNSKAPGLLVSVRNVTEAMAALEGGADVIDVKEPARGSLGAADPTTIADIVYAVDGRAPVTAALGELNELNHGETLTNALSLPSGVSLFKIGMAACDRLPDWQTAWINAITALRAKNLQAIPQPVAVVYADWRQAGAPPPEQILNAAASACCPALLVDTWDKSGGTLFDHWPADDLSRFADRVREKEMLIVLAGSLIGKSITDAARLAPDLIAVRTAACNGGRNSPISTNRVGDLKQTLEQQLR
jgi:uncharacterized protein (UPF0264 family)